jgi:hypothetical protein
MQSDAFPTPHFKPSVHRFVRMAGPLYMRLALGVKKVVVFNRATLKAELAAFKEGKQRLIIAFRHTAVEDAPLVLMGIRESHLAVLYGRDVLNWAGSITKYIFPRLGFIAVQNRATNRDGIQYLRSEAQSGRFPIALAPEGQVTYHAHKSAPIEAGVANLALWASEGGQEVTILPIGIGYKYADDTSSFVKGLLSRWQKESSITLQATTTEEQLIEACEQTLALVATWWDLPLPSRGTFTERRDELCTTLLTKGEELALLSPGEGTILDRLFRLRFTGEDTLFNQETTKRTALEAAKIAMLQERAHLYLRINQTVDVLEYLDTTYVSASPTPSRMAEVALSLLDVINRLNGGSINSRFSPKGKVGGLYIGTPIRLGDIISGASGRKGHIKAIQTATVSALEEASAQLEEEWTRSF